MEKKLSEELQQCLEERKCTGCDHYDVDTALACRGLLQKAYERIKTYEEVEERKRENTERFTEKFKDGRNIIRKGIANVHHNGFGWFCDGEAVDKLAEYEDLEEKGRFPVILPCKIGDIVWNSQKVFDEFPYLPYPIKVSGFSVLENGIYLEGLYGSDNRECSILISEIGKNVFLSENEALQKIKEMEKHHET